MVRETHSSRVRGDSSSGASNSIGASGTNSPVSAPRPRSHPRRSRRLCPDHDNDDHRGEARKRRGFESEREERPCELRPKERKRGPFEKVKSRHSQPRRMREEGPDHQSHTLAVQSLQMPVSVGDVRRLLGRGGRGGEIVSNETISSSQKPLIVPRALRVGTSRESR